MHRHCDARGRADDHLGVCTLVPGIGCAAADPDLGTDDREKLDEYAETKRRAKKLPLLVGNLADLYGEAPPEVSALADVMSLKMLPKSPRSMS